MKLQFFVALTKDAIGYDKMEMRVKIESRAKILDKADGSNLSLGDMGATSEKSFPDLFNDNLEDVLENCLILKVVSNAQ